MKTIFTCSFFLITASLMFAPHAQATPTWAAVYSQAYGKDASPSTENRANYSVYYCTAEAAADMFDGATTRSAIEKYLAYVENFNAGKAAMGDTQGSVELTAGDYALGRYSFINYTADGIADGTYFAVAFYKDEAFRVFDVLDTELLTEEGDLLFTDKETTQGKWTQVTNVPEPASGILLLIGFVGLALKRRNV